MDAAASNEMLEDHLPSLPRWIANALVSAVIAGVLVVGSGPDMAIGFLPLLVVAGVIATAVLITMQRRYRVLALFALLTVAAFGLAVTNVPSMVRLKLSEAQIVQAGEKVIAGEAVDRAGSYGIQSSWADDDGCAWMETQSIAIDSMGIAYCPTPPANLGQLEHRFGSIYEYAID